MKSWMLKEETSLIYLFSSLLLNNMKLGSVHITYQCWHASLYFTLQNAASNVNCLESVTFVLAVCLATIRPDDMS
jgi:hypothetical protein